MLARISICAALAAFSLGACAEPPEPRTPETLQMECEHGSGRACADLGQRYLNGIGVDMDAGRGVKLIEKGCELKWAGACTLAGGLFAEGIGVEPSAQKAFKHFEAGCALGDGAACHNLAVLHGSGEVGKSDPAKVEQYLRKACDLKVGMACSRLAATLKGIKSIQMLERGCALGDMRGCVLLGHHYEAGLEVPRSIERALEFYTRACQGDATEGCKAQVRLSNARAARR